MSKHLLLREGNISFYNTLGPFYISYHYPEKVKGKAIPLQALIGPEVSRSLRLPDLKTIGT
jgi:hypothetical protein